MITPQRGSTVSFYSYKGGVGRTMAVINVAMALAHNGFRVMVVDLDLLAPGVQEYPRFREAVGSSEDSAVPGKTGYSYIPPAERDLGEGGILDLVERQLWSFARSKKQPSPFREAIRPSEESKERWQKWKRNVYTHNTSGGHIDVLPAGPADHRALGTLAQIGWYRFLKDFKGLEFILSMRDKWWRTEYDFTIVDSRTGLSDYLQFCVGILPDVAVLIAGLNEQNVEGFPAALESVKDVIVSRDSDLFIIPVLSLIPAGELDSVRERFRSAEEKLDRYRESGSKSLRFLTSEPVKLPYVATLAVAERPVVPDDYHSPIFREYVRIAEMLVRHRFAPIDNLLNEAIYEAAAKGLADDDVSMNLQLARKFSKDARYMYGLIRSEKLNAQRLAFTGKEEDRPECLLSFRRAIELIRERRHLKDGQPWIDADSTIGHWQIELDTLVFYARILGARPSDAEAAVAAFSDVLEFLETFEKRNHADIFSDRDWDRYSQELRFTGAFCHLGLLEAQINFDKDTGGVLPKTLLEASLHETQALFDQLMPTEVNPALKKRLSRSADEIKRLP